VRVRAKTVRVRRSPHLVFYWRSHALVVHNYATGDIAHATPVVCALLDACSEWQSPSDLRAALDTSPPLLRRLIGSLLSRNLLHRSDRPVPERERAMTALDRWNPAAGFFHSATRDVRFIPTREAERTLRRQAKQWPMPRSVKRIRGARTLRLPKPVVEGPFPEVLLARRTWRRFSPRAVTQADLATSLALSIGVQEWVPTATGEVALKTSPSGGARHPIECYVLVRRVAGVRPGLYHYAADRHRLEEIRRGDMTRRLRVWMPHSDYFAGSGFILLLTAVFDRLLWRYPYARAYRAALAEAGHVCQTFCLTATWLGLAPFCLMGLADTEIERDLGIDGVRESVLYAAGAGVRPPGVNRAPLAKGTLVTRPNPVFRRR
jgi:SagB-type dehydrogenase family enzyme